MRGLVGVLVIGLVLILATTPFTTVLFDSINPPTSTVNVTRNGDEVLVEGNIAKDPLFDWKRVKRAVEEKRLICN